jgi:D-alanyl-lipoteichoic acid acyltransferase DltB (MBOAT superfamily)
MGFELIQNFEHPYFATDITAFWRRWHISLSTWLRDYLYIPLGGNRHGRWRTDFNLFLTMFLGGLWHGASWKFAVWGSLHGLYLALHKLTKGARKTGVTHTHPEPVTESPEIPRFRHPRFTPANLVKALGTFHLVALTWIFFAAADISTAWTYLLHLAGPGVKVAAVHAVTLRADDLAAAFGGVALMLVLVDVPQYLKRDECALLRWSFWPRMAAFLTLAVATLLCRGSEHVPFIYFVF